MQKSKPTPKFTSFRPKAPEAFKGSSVKEDVPSDTLHHQRHQRRHEAYGGLRQKQSQERADGGEQSLSRDARGKQYVPARSQAESFISDRRGDPDNLRYGSIHRYSVPRYTRAGLDTVLGLPSSMKIDRRESTDRQISFIGRDQGSNMTTRQNKSLFAKLTSSEEVAIFAVNVEFSKDLQKSYLPFEAFYNRRKAGDGSSEWRSGSGSGSEDNSDVEQDYRAIGGDLAVSRLGDPSSQHNGERLEPAARDDHEITRIKLSLKVDQNPGDGQAWLDLIHHQDAQRSWNIFQTQAERQASAEIRLSMYEKALKKVAGPTVEALTNGFMRDAALLWDSHRLNKKWADIIPKQTSSTSLWLQYLGFMQTNSSLFRFDDVKTVFLEGIDVFARQSSPQLLAYIILRYTRYLRESGFSEQAFAIWQVMLEFNFRRPNMAKTDLTKSFESFWESEAPRIGENDSPGWAKYDRSGGEISEAESRQWETQPKVSSIVEWQKYEQVSYVRLPARTIDDVEEEDPFSVVLFSDIAPFLLDFQESYHSVLIDAFLGFCGLPTVWQPENYNQDSFIHNDIYGGQARDNATSLKRESEILKGSDGVSTKSEGSQVMSMQIKNVRLSIDSLFAPAGSFFSIFQGLAVERSPVDLHWMSRTLQALVDIGIGGTELAEYFLAVELYCFPERARKSAKALLKKQPSNLRLYNAYALIEYRLGKPDTAKIALIKTISMSRSDPDIIFLTHTLAWEAVDMRDTHEALKQLLLGAQSQDTAAILKAQGILLEGRDQALHARDEIRALAYVDCLILLSYLSSDTPLEASIAVFNSNSSFLTSKFPSRGSSQVLMHQSLARLLYHHTTYKSFKPSQIRDAMKRSISIFPTNTVFLSLYTYNESRFKIHDRVRSVAHDILSRPESPVSQNMGDDQMQESQLIPHEFAIHSELSRSIALGSNVHSIRSAFEHAVTDPATKHNASIWMQYFKFEVSTFRADSSGSSNDGRRACDVFYRSITACPWVKSLYLLAFQHLSNLMKPEEIKSINELMIERELRIRAPLGNICG